MSLCNFTRLVSPNTCLGDSLATFNANFSALDEGLCRLPDTNSGTGISLQTEITEQEQTKVRLSTKNSFAYSPRFEYTNGRTSYTQNIYLKDGTTIPVTTFTYVSALTAGSDPIATFSTISLTDSLPKVTLFWTASGSTETTVFGTNSANNISVGPIEFNGPVTALLSSGNILYVGGEFTTVGGNTYNKFCQIDINSGGTSNSVLGNVGSTVGNPLSSQGDLESYGTVNSITQFETLLIVGGTFRSLAKGRGLTILDRNTGIVYPFYVNGSVKDLMVVGSVLYVAGAFDYINYSAQSVSVISGLRVYTNGLAKINLATLYSFPNSSIDKTFAKNITTLFTSNTTSVNSLATKNDYIYIGGLFDIKSGSTLLAKNLAGINTDGTQNTTWKPIVGGEVLTLDVDGNYLYVGGSFNSMYTSAEYYSKPRLEGDKYTAYNAICFKLVTASSPSYEFNWKPVFNGPVTKFAFHNAEFGSYVYCYGQFTQTNGFQSGYLAAIEKSYENNTHGRSYLWNNHLHRPAPTNNNALLRYSNSLIVGGNFTKVNNIKRPYLAKLTGAYESLSAVALSAVHWDLGAQTCPAGGTLEIDTTDFVTASGYSGSYGIVNQTTFTVKSRTFNGYKEGELIKFFLRRPKVIGTYKYPVYVIGWKVDFN